MPDKKLIMGDAYKDALKERDEALQRQKIERFRMERKQAQLEKQAENQRIIEKNQAKIREKRDELAKCEMRFKEAQASKIENATLAGIVLLGLFALCFGTGALIYALSSSQDVGIVLVAISIVLLIMSLIEQVSAIDTERRIRDYSVKIKRLKFELGIKN